MKLFRRAVVLAHRYLGIALSLLIAIWFASGIVMMYAGGMPRVAPQFRLERLAALDMAAVRLTPAEAAARAELQVSPGRISLLTLMDRPAYRLTERGTTTVYADNGEIVHDLSIDEARAIAAAFLRVAGERVRFVETLDEVDQWTLGQARQIPLHKFAVADDDASELYVSPHTGEVTMLTTRRSRTLAWLGTIPHWLYFTALRTNQPLWYDVVVWTSAVACIIALLGLVLGVTQFRRVRPFRLSAAIPYSGWMRWHYITGAVFGIFTLTWAFSGLLSMEPWDWTRAAGLEVDREVFTGGPIDLAHFPAIDPAAWEQANGGRAVKEVELARIQGRPYYVVRYASETADARRERLHQPYLVGGRGDTDRVLLSAGTLEARHQPFTTESLMQRLREAFPDVPVVEQQLLSEYDSYYYSRARQTPLPILRVKFADPAETWVYIDPEMSQVVAEIHRLARVERWLYNGLHSLDFSFWYNTVAWDVGMILLCLGGLTSSGIGVFLGVRRMRRAARRSVTRWSDVGETVSHST